MFRARIEAAIGAAIQSIQAEGDLGQFEVPYFSVEVPEKGRHGDYATNIAMIIAKVAKRNPMEFAEMLAKKLSAGGGAFIEKAEVAAHGFINITLSPDALREAAAGALAKPDAWGTSDAGGGKTARLYYFQLNIAKRPHVGHLRSAVIGDIQ